MPRGSLRPEDPVPPLDHVQIDFENPRLGERRLEAAGDDELAQLAQRAARGRQVEILRQLLGNRAGAANGTTLLPVDAHRLAKLFQVDPLVIPECSVLRHQNRPLQRLGDSGIRDPSLDVAYALPFTGRRGGSQLHERGCRGIRLGEYADVGKRQVDVGEGSKGDRAEYDEDPEKRNATFSHRQQF